MSRHLRDAGHDAVCAQRRGCGGRDAAGRAFRRRHHGMAAHRYLGARTCRQPAPRSAEQRRPYSGGIRPQRATGYRAGPGQRYRRLRGQDQPAGRAGRACQRGLAPTCEWDAIVLQVGAINPGSGQSQGHGDRHEIELAPAEFRLMAHFMENQGRVLGRKQLLAQVWNRRKGIGERTVDVHVRRLRAALHPFGCEDLLQTVRGFGYRFG